MTGIFSHADYASVEEQQADVVVVGTGAGGAAAGAELAAAGLEVVFLEEGGYHPTSSFNPYVQESVPRLYRNASATVILGKPPIPYIEGRCVGGSTVLNGGMTWRPPSRVLADWERDVGPELGEAGLTPLFERVEQRVNAAPQHPASIGNDNRLMAEGARTLGWEYLENQRNQRNCVGANNCVLGCPTAGKQSTLISYIPRALADGARCLTEVRADRLLVEGGRCVGVEGRAVNPRTRREDKIVRVRARAVVIACGAVHTPNLLLQHRLGRPSGQLGKNFLCHPNAKVLAVYPFELDAHEGVSQGGQVRELHEQGIVFAENFIPPGALAAQIPYLGDEAWDLMKDYRRMALTGVLVEDSRPGVVKRRFGQPVPLYDITPLDFERFLTGIARLSELHFAMGAEKVLLPFSDTHVARSMDDVRRAVQSPRKITTIELFTVHLMGTARMGRDARSSVCDTGGELWDLPGCFVADASLFPTAIGVNPQIAIMALATLVARRIAERDAARRSA